MDKRGYIYTLITIGFVMLVVSMASFYIETTRLETESYSNKITTDELYYFIESSKKDAGRAAGISAQRAIAYTTGHVLETGIPLRGYDMQPCTLFDYPTNGSQAAIAELMLCGTIDGEETSRTAKHMKNHTLLEWIERIKRKAKETNIIFDKLEISSIDIAMYDAFHLAVMIKLNIIAHDRENRSTYVGYDIPAETSILSIDSVIDPLYYIMTKDIAASNEKTIDLVKYIHRCSFREWNGTTINKILNTSMNADYRCYYVSNISEYGENLDYKLNETGPSLFDRLDGNLNLSKRYRDQSIEYFNNSNIGLESFINLYNLWVHGVSVTKANNSWIDYRYWQNITGDCCVNGTILYNLSEYGVANWSLRLDYAHDQKYRFDKTTCYKGDICDHT